MSPENFCYWLMGMFEISKPVSITPLQLQEIKNHLDLVFYKVTPNISEPIISASSAPKIPTADFDHSQVKYCAPISLNEKLRGDCGYNYLNTDNYKFGDVMCGAPLPEVPCANVDYSKTIQASC